MAECTMSVYRIHRHISEKASSGLVHLLYIRHGECSVDIFACYYSIQWVADFLAVLWEET